MTDRELMQQALEALELHAKQYPHMQKGYTVDAITALRERLAQPYCDDCGGTDPECPLGTHWEGCEEVHPECRKTRREWAGLTDREIEEIARHEDEHGSGPWHLAFARAIEAKLKEKNA